MPTVPRLIFAVISAAVLATLGSGHSKSETQATPMHNACPADGKISVENVYVCSGFDLVDTSYFAMRPKAGDAASQPAVDDKVPAGARSSVGSSLSSTTRQSAGTAYIERALLWTAATSSARSVDGRLQIEVCWINPTDAPGEREDRELTRAAIEETWHVEANVRFATWGGCVPNTVGGVRILISDQGPAALVGRIADSRSPSMWLNFTFANWSEECQNRDEAVSKITHDDCVYSIAVHEFGHILGFYHEVAPVL
jgi:hypothetical protein